MNNNKLIFLLLFLLLNAEFCLAQSITLVTVGDSLTIGDGDDGVGGGYPARLLTRLLNEYPGTTLSNHAISGDTTQDMINKQLEAAIADLNAAPAGSLKIALVWIGSNDLFGFYASDVCTEYYSDLETCEQFEMGYISDNVNTILQEMNATGATVFIALLDDQSKRPVITNSSLRSEIFSGITDAEVPMMSAQIANYNNQVTTHATTHGAFTVDFYSTTIFENDISLSDDGNHPNGVGYDAITEIWYQAISSINDVSAPTLAISINAGIATANWNRVMNADSYTLYFAPFPYEGEDTIGHIAMGSETSVSAELPSGAGFYVAVTSINNGVESSYSNIELIQMP